MDSGEGSVLRSLRRIMRCGMPRAVLGRKAGALGTGLINPFLMPGQQQTQAAKDLILSVIKDSAAYEVAKN